MQTLGIQLNVGFNHDFAGRLIDDVGSGHRAIQLGGFHFHLGDLRGTQRLQDRGRNLAAGVGNLLALHHDGVCRLGSEQVGVLAVSFTFQCSLPSDTPMVSTV